MYQITDVLVSLAIERAYRREARMHKIKITLFITALLILLFAIECGTCDWFVFPK